MPYERCVLLPWAIKHESRNCTKLCLDILVRIQPTNNCPIRHFTVAFFPSLAAMPKLDISSLSLLLIDNHPGYPGFKKGDHERKSNGLKTLSDILQNYPLQLAVLYGYGIWIKSIWRLPCSASGDYFIRKGSISFTKTRLFTSLEIFMLDGDFES